MKLYGTPLEKLLAGFIPTEHPVAVKRIADLQRAGYVYIKP
jgi:intracellular sulfur oxidation DsrE/DsrF family protein